MYHHVSLLLAKTPAKNRFEIDILRFHGPIPNVRVQDNMPPIITLHLLWGEPAVSRYKSGRIDNTVLLGHAAYDFLTDKEAQAFLLGVKENRRPETWMVVTNLLDIPRLGQPLKSKLFQAIEQGDVKTLEELFNAGVEPNVRAPNGMTPLQAAVIAGHVKVVETLLEHGADPNLPTQDAQQESAMHLAARHPGPKGSELVSLLTTSTADLNATNSHLQTPLHLAVERDNLTSALALIKEGAKLDEKDQAGQTPRHLFQDKYAGIINDPTIDDIQMAIEKTDAQLKKRSNFLRKQTTPTPYKTPN